MEFTDYLRDRWYRYLSCFLAYVLIFVFMKAFRVSAALEVVTAIILIIAMIVPEGIEFYHRNKFYHQVNSGLSTLDQKYLITEMLEEGDFYESGLLLEILRIANKSMCEKISEYRNNSRDFQEFLELWVHEVKLPLQSLRLAIRNLDLPEGEEERLSEQIRRIDFSTDKVLYFSRSKNPEKDYVIKETELKKLVSEVMMKHREDLLIHEINIKTGQLHGTVFTDAKWMSFILSQILTNSIKYTENLSGIHDFAKKVPTIWIDVQEREKCTILSIRDNGIGIPANDLPRIFEKSFTGENGRSGAKSTGMGLYLAKKLCDRLGHGLEADSVQGEYTELRIVFGKDRYMEEVM